MTATLITVYAHITTFWVFRTIISNICGHLLFANEAQSQTLTKYLVKSSWQQRLIAIGNDIPEAALMCVLMIEVKYKT